MKTVRVLTVCLGNICRSPAAQGILEATSKNSRGVFLELDSAGTAAYHVGNAPDPRSIKSLREMGIDISAQKARQIATQDFYDFDWILAMDKQNLKNLKAIKPDDATAKVVMFGAFNETVDFGEVADPYYGNDDGFTAMRAHIESISKDFLAYLSNE